jgi:hypothetical protein
MCKLKAWGLAAALVVGLTATTGLAADDESGPEESKDVPKTSAIRWSPTFLRLFHLDEKKPTPKKAPAKPKKESAKKTVGATKPGTVVDEAVVGRARAEAVFMRHTQVCDKLSEIAVRTNDTELLHRAEALEERAWAIYAQRTTNFRGPNGGLEPDEKTMDKQLKPGPRRSSDTAGYTVPGNDRTSRAAVQEVNP